MSLEDSLGLVLRKAAQESTAAIDALEARLANLGQVRRVQASTPDMLGRLKEWRKQIDGIQDLQGAWFRGRAPVGAVSLPLDKPHPDAVAGEFAGNKQAGWAGADNQDVTLRQQPRILFDLAEVLKV